MKALQRASLRMRLVLIISLTVVVPLLVVSFLLARYQREVARADLVRSLDVTERLVGQLVRRRVDLLRVETRRVLGAVSDGRLMHRDVSESPLPQLERAMAASRLEAVALVDSRGRVQAVVSAPGMTADAVPWAALARGIEERERLRGIFSGRTFVLGYVVPLVGAQDGQRLRLVGVMTLASWSLDELRTVSGVEITFVDGRDRRLTTRFDRFGQTRLGGRVSIEELGLRRGKGGVATFSDTDAARRMRNLSDLFGRDGEGLAGSLLLEADQASAVVDGSGDLWVVWLLIPLSLLLALLSGIFISRIIVGPIVKLRASALRFAATPGVAEPLALDAPGEVGDLVSAFNAMTAEIQNAFEKIKRIHFSARKIAATFELSSLFELAAHEMRRTLDAEASLLFVRAGDTLALQASAGSLEPHASLTLAQLGELEEAWRAPKSRLVTLSRERFETLFGRHSFLSRRVLVVPLRLEAEPFGTLVFFWKERSGGSEQDLFLGDALASSLSIQIRNIEYLFEMRTKALLDAELAAAKAVQEQLLPRLHVLPGLRLATRYVAATQTGGDWFGFFFNRKRHRLDVLVADVTGHGFPSALLSGVFCGALYAAEEAVQELGSSQVTEVERLRMVATLVNRIILQTGRQELTVTMALVSFSPETGELLFLNAGHNAPFWLLSRERKVKGLVATGSRLGYAGDPQFDVVSTRLEPGDGLFLYTDGLIENRGPQGVLASRKVRQILAGAGDAIAAHGLVWDEAIRVWADEAPADDVTTVALTWEGPTSPEEWEHADVPGVEPLFVSDGTKVF